MHRTTTIAGLLLATGAMAASAVPAQASTASDVKKLKHDVKVLSGRLKKQTAALNGFVGCLQYVNLSQFGATDGSFGYVYSNNFFDPADVPFATTGIDVAGPTDSFSSFLILKPACVGAGRSSAARVFAPMIPASTMVPQPRYKGG